VIPLAALLRAREGLPAVSDIPDIAASSASVSGAVSGAVAAATAAMPKTMPATAAGILP
jgi:hypothetical protein